jgi:probable F420-dependent oxidoreductase
MLTAISAWDLQRETRGRFVLGLGSQVRRHIERRFSAPFSRPAARLKDYTLAVRACWAAFAGQSPLAHHGGYYTLDYLPEMMNPGPLPVPAPPIWLAALGPVMFRTAAEVADGALIHPVHTLDYLAQVAEPAIGEGLERAGRAREEFTLSATVLAIVAEAHDEAEREAVRAQFAFYASTPAYRPVLELHGWGALGDRLRDLVRRGERLSMGSVVPDEVLETFCIVADTWEEAVRAARRRYAGVVDRVMFQAPVPATVTLPAP